MCATENSYRDEKSRGRVPVTNEDVPEVGRSLTVKEMCADDQPRERAIRYGISSLATADLFAIILRTGTPGTPITDLCRDMMRQNGGRLLDLERQSREQLMMIKGIGESKALQIEAVMEIVRRYGKEKVGERPQLRMSRDIYDIIRPEIANLPHEEIWVVMTNRSNYVTGMQRISEGGSGAATFDVKKMMRALILARAEGVVMCHNHPSGVLKPSLPDDNITRGLKSACEVLELNCIDHLIVTPDGYYSYRDNGRILV